jgi:hypothetical protein
VILNDRNIVKNRVVIDGAFVHLFNYPGIFSDGMETVSTKLL